MSQVQVTYTGNDQYEALDTKAGKQVSIDCPMTRGLEFGPDSLIAAGLGACMLISMNSFADRHGLDVTGATADVDVSLGGKPELKISALDVKIRVPHRFEEGQQTALEKAAGACPIKHSFGPDTEISTDFQFGGA